MKKDTGFYIFLFSITFFAYCKKDNTEKEKKAIVTTIAGTGEAGYLDATALFAKFNSPKDVAVHTDGTIYITDRFNARVRKISPNGLVSTFAGNGNLGNTNGNGTAASFIEISLIALDAQANAYVLDGSISQVRKISPGADVSAYAGTDSWGFADGRADTARFSQCWGIAVDAQGNIFVADSFNERIRKIANGYVTTVAGSGTPGYTDGNASQAQFKKPYGIAVDKQGNLYVGDYDNYRIRKITPAGMVSTVAGSGIRGFADGSAALSQFYSLADMVCDSRGNLYVIDLHCIRKITPAGEVTTIAGNGSIAGFADGEGNLARFYYPAGLAIDAGGNLYVADSQNHCIRKISFE